MNVYETKRVALFNTDCLDMLRTLPDNSIDSCVTDPPYGLSKEPNVTEVLTKWLAGEDYQHKGGGFMGKTWDSFVPGPSVWREVFRVLKPGAHLLVFAGTRTEDLMGMSVRLAGFERRDTFAWLYGSGYPKSLDISKAIDKAAGAERKLTRPGVVQRDGYGGDWDTGSSCTRPRYDEPATAAAAEWEGWGTALKPAHEPILVFRKPLAGTVAANVLEYGTGGLNIGGCRIGYESEADLATTTTKNPGRNDLVTSGTYGADRPQQSVNTAGRWPANVVLDEEAAALLDAQTGVSVSRKGKPRASKEPGDGWGMTNTGAEYNDSGGASRFFYVAKASRSEREAGCENLPAKAGHEAVDREEGSAGVNNPRAGAGRTAKQVRNHHPTVKPVALMRWLVRLVTPPGGIVLDPYMGSGTTGVAALEEGFSIVCAEVDTKHGYFDIARARVEHAEFGDGEIGEERAAS